MLIFLCRFLREDDDVDERQLSWDDRLAKKYYSALYREYAVCELKHYKTGNVRSILGMINSPTHLDAL